MAVRTVAVQSPGDMGSAVGRALRENGFDVISCLEGRSERTRSLAAAAGIADGGSMADVVRRADLILSIMVPSEAETLARHVAHAIRETGADVAFADCNAISPESTKRVGRIIEEAGGKFIDAGIIGGPPRGGAPPRFYASGPHEAILGELDGRGIAVPLMGGEVGRASAIKMCFASITKGTNALYTAAMVAAESLGVYDDLLAEMSAGQADTVRKMERVSTLSDRAFRWIGEMEEIAATFADAGVTPKIHEGAAETFRMIADSPIGHERPETVDRSRSLHDTIKLFVEGIKAKP
jgi:3-hydroxyisobutyrate dehydrogenase-like beta-hydroxyacid dehydrogenase